MKAVPLLLALMYCISGRAQYERTEPSFSLQSTAPSFGLQKINALIDSARELKLKKMHTSKRDTPDMIFIHVSLSEEVYNTLSLREKFTYNMINPESYWQNCSLSFFGCSKNQIPARLPKMSDLFNWSERQIKFFEGNKDSVMEFIKIDDQMNHRLGLNDKTVINMINAGKLTPLLQKCYLKTRDCEILTVLMVLMIDNHYSPFIQSDLYKKLYTGSTHQIYRNFIDRYKNNEEYILRLATNFYNGLSK